MPSYRVFLSRFDSVQKAIALQPKTDPLENPLYFPVVDVECDDPLLLPEIVAEQYGATSNELAFVPHLYVVEPTGTVISYTDFLDHHAQ